MNTQFLWRVSMHSMQNAILFYHFRPSVWPWHCGIVTTRMHMLSDVLQRLIWASVYFWAHCHCKVPRGIPVSSDVLHMGWKNFAIFGRKKNRIVSQKRVARYEPWLLWITNSLGSHRLPINPCGFQWPWVTLKCGTRGDKLFLANLRNYAHINIRFDL